MDEKERKALEKELDDYEDQKRRRYSYKPPNSYKTAFNIVILLLSLGSFGTLLWLAGRKSGKDNCKR